MEPIFTELNLVKTLLSPITVNGEEITEITIKKMIIRPIIKRIVFAIKELDRVILYEGEELFEAHKNDSENALIAALLVKINADHNS